MTDFSTGGSGYSADASRASAEALNARQAVKELHDEVGRLRLVCAALWELVKERTNLTEADLVARVAIMDAKDGVADGMMTRRAQPCAKCGKQMASRLTKCMFCGAERAAATVFEGI
jgi:hypothetical protein